MNNQETLEKLTNEYCDFNFENLEARYIENGTYNIWEKEELYMHLISLIQILKNHRNSSDGHFKHIENLNLKKIDEFYLVNSLRIIITICDFRIHNEGIFDNDFDFRLYFIQNSLRLHLNYLNSILFGTYGHHGDEFDFSIVKTTVNELNTIDKQRYLVEVMSDYKQAFPNWEEESIDKDFIIQCQAEIDRIEKVNSLNEINNISNSFFSIEKKKLSSADFVRIMNAFYIKANPKMANGTDASKGVFMNNVTKYFGIKGDSDYYNILERALDNSDDVVLKIFDELIQITQKAMEDKQERRTNK